MLRDRDLSDVPTRVPTDEEPTATCPYCARPFKRPHERDLHLGESHERTVTDTEREAYEHALSDESDELFLYHFKVVIALGIIYSATILVYMVALGSGIL